MDLLNKIDLVLTCLYQESKNPPTITFLQEKLRNTGITQEELKDCLQKLHKDGFIRYEFEGGFVAFYHDFAHFRISFEGKFFYETSRGYKNKTAISSSEGSWMEALEFSQRRQASALQLLTTWIAVGTILGGAASLCVAVYYLRQLFQQG